MTTNVCVSKEAIMDLVKVKGQFDSIVESLELMAEPEFMNSFSKAKEQIKSREFDDWNEL